MIKKSIKLSLLITIFSFNNLFCQNNNDNLQKTIVKALKKQTQLDNEKFRKDLDLILQKVVDSKFAFDTLMKYDILVINKNIVNASWEKIDQTTNLCLVTGDAFSNTHVFDKGIKSIIINVDIPRRQLKMGDEIINDAKNNSRIMESWIIKPTIEEYLEFYVNYENIYSGKASNYLSLLNNKVFPFHFLTNLVKLISIRRVCEATTNNQMESTDFNEEIVANNLKFIGVTDTGMGEYLTLSKILYEKYDKIYGFPTIILTGNLDRDISYLEMQLQREIYEKGQKKFQKFTESLKN